MREYKEIYLAGGCFWGIEHLMKAINGVISTQTGYANGRTENPSYEDVRYNMTGHAETVKVVFDANKAPTEFLLGLFFEAIDPTSVNKQGEDEGLQYRTGVYYTDEAMLKPIRSAVSKLEKEYGAPLALEVAPLENFFSAEEYHQDYLDKHPTGYCHVPFELIEKAKKAKPE